MKAIKMFHPFIFKLKCSSTLRHLNGYYKPYVAVVYEFEAKANKLTCSLKRHCDHIYLN